MQVISIGELLWDVFGPRELLGGAPLNFSATAQKLGNSVSLLTAVGSDARGKRALEGMKSLGLSTGLVQIVPNHPTGVALVVMDKAGNATYRIQRPAAFDYLAGDDLLLSHLQSSHADWIYFGTLAHMNPANEALLRRLAGSLPGIQCFYDLNLRDGHWDLPLVQRLSAMATVLKLNESEAETLFHATCSSQQFSLERFCRHWTGIYGLKTICVTLGSQGCAVFFHDTFNVFGGFESHVVDTVGAGDSFAAAFLQGLDQDWPMERTAAFANAVGSIVVSRAGATPDWTLDEVSSMIAKRLSQGLVQGGTRS